MGKKKKSPCIDVCKYKGPNGWCTACGMTSKESRDWKSMKPYNRTILQKQLDRRKVEMNGRTK